MPDTDLEIRGAGSGGGGGEGRSSRSLDKGGGNLQKKCFFFFSVWSKNKTRGSDAATSGKQISRIFQRQIKLQFLRTEIYFKNRHSLTPFDHSGGLKP